jgi:hypothetical protein
MATSFLGVRCGTILRETDRNFLDRASVASYAFAMDAGPRLSPETGSSRNFQNTVTPLMYGYMRAPDDVPDDDLERVVREMRCFAETNGFCYGTTFFENQRGSRVAFDELTAELQRAKARHVIVPSLAHLSTHPILLNHLVEQLAHCVGAEVFELDD